MTDFEAMAQGARRCTAIVARSRRRGGPVFTCNEPAEGGSELCAAHQADAVAKIQGTAPTLVIEDIIPMASRVVRCLETTRCILSDEKQAQLDIATGLAALHIPFSREERLSPGDVVDFLIAGAIALEVKLNRARRRHILAQLERYASNSRVEAVILATNRAMGLPEVIAGKPAFYASLGRAWI